MEFEGLFEKPTITKERVTILQSVQPRRISFAFTHKDQPKFDPGEGYVGSFSVPYYESVGRIFEEETALKLYKGRNFGNYWRSIKSDGEFSAISEWVRQQGTRVFLRDCLDLSIALDRNRPDPDSQRRTQLGEFENRAKHRHDERAIVHLSLAFSEALSALPVYRDCRFLAAVPAPPGKSFHLPSILAKRIASDLGLTDLTNCFQFEGSKRSIKELGVAEKWDAWEEAGLQFDAPEECRDRPVILIDDKYQSGVTLQFVASRLLEAGVGEVYGLCAVKTLRDTDNQ